ncbi:MAG: type VI secretion system tube protein Hcp [Candidatus Korobacteraceae bacterium]
MTGYGRHLLCGIMVLVIGAPLLQAQTRSVTMAPAPAAASADYYLKLDGVPGESSDKDHKGWIEISSYSWGMSNHGSSGLATGKRSASAQTPSSPGTLTIVKRIDKASPLLMKRCSEKQTGQDMVVHLPASSGAGKSEYVLHGAVVANCGRTAAGESISLNYEKITMKATESAARSTSR